MCESLSLPNAAEWRFDHILEGAPHRAAALEAAGSGTEFTAAMEAAFRRNFSNDEARFAYEEAEACKTDLRVLCQIHLTPQEFDWFFNARTGYRAHFRMAPESGLRLTAELVSLLRQALELGGAEELLGRHLNAWFVDLGPVRIPKRFALRSLDPDISKIWLCGKLIDANGSQRDLPTGATEPRLIVGDMEWLAWYRDAPHTWIEVKGGFVGPRGIYQVKDSWGRALKLSRTGTV